MSLWRHTSFDPVYQLQDQSSIWQEKKKDLQAFPKKIGRFPKTFDSESQNSSNFKIFPKLTRKHSKMTRSILTAIDLYVSFMPKSVPNNSENVPEVNAKTRGYGKEASD